ncbi:MAG: SulP family inorganic anion transporter [Bacteroidetes bacterium]|nr:SulP family inorganic anion transporter [Bacteroidota bacterium]
MRSKTFGSDIKAGIVVFLVALPLCLGIAMACNVPLFSGIISGVIGGILVTTFSGSRYSVSGPAAGLTLIVISSIATLGSYEVFLAAVVFGGVLQIILGLLKAGGIGNFVPNAVIKGMLAGIGIILIIKQIPHLFGYDKDPEGDMEFFQLDGENSFTELINMVNFITPGALIIGIISFILLYICGKPFYKESKIFSNIPAPLLIVVFGILLTISFKGYEFLRVDPQHLVNLPTIKNFEDLKSNLAFPDFSFISKGNFWLVVVTIGLVASLETLLNIEATDKLDPEKNESNSNKELLAQGTGNIVAGLLGGLPITSVIVRSSANIGAGAKTKLSVIFHALLLLISVIAFPQILALIPNACLAAILIATGFKLTKLQIFKEQYKYGIQQFLPFIVTVVIMLRLGILKGVGAGIAVSIFFIIRDNIKFSFDSSSDTIDGKLYYLIKLPQHVTFFNKGYLIRFFNNIKPNSKVIIDGSINKTVNRDSQDVISDFISTSKNKKIEIELIKYTDNG